MSNDRRFYVEQDRSYSAKCKWINDYPRWSNTKVNMLKTYTVYEFVGSPSYQTPVFTGNENECKQYVENIYKKPVRWCGGWCVFVNAK